MVFINLKRYDQLMVDGMYLSIYTIYYERIIKYGAFSFMGESINQKKEKENSLHLEPFLFFDRRITLSSYL